MGIGWIHQPTSWLTEIPSPDCNGKPTAKKSFFVVLAVQKRPTEALCSARATAFFARICREKLEIASNKNNVENSSPDISNGLKPKLSTKLQGKKKA